LFGPRWPISSRLVFSCRRLFGRRLFGWRLFGWPLFGWRLPGVG